MLKHTQILILIFCILTAQIQSEKQQQKKPKNFLKNFNPEQVEKLVQKFKYVMIGFVNKKTHKGQEIKKAMKLVSQQHQEEKDFFWTWVDESKMTKELKEKLDVYSKNEVHLYFQQHRKKYHGEVTAEKLYNWFLEIKGAQVSTKKSYNDIHKLDSHYFVYSSEQFYNKNKEKLDILQKLIYPIQIIKGFEDQNFKKSFKRKQKEREFFLYREYRNLQARIGESSNLLRISNYIEENEFPDLIKPNRQSLKLVLDLKIPTVVYFTSDKRDKNIGMIQRLANKHKEYFLFMYVSCQKKCNKYKNFMKNFLGIRKTPSLRILQIKKKIQRFKFLGKYEKDLIQYFFQNYLNSHLKSYSINQNLKYKKEKYGIKRLNTKSVAKVLSQFQEFTLIYVYSNIVMKKKIIKKHILILKQIQDEFEVNDYFRVYVLNNDRNDFKGKRSNKLPTLILKPRSNNLTAYNGKFEYEEIKKFLLEKNQYLQSKFSTEL